MAPRSAGDDNVNPSITSVPLIIIHWRGDRGADADHDTVCCDIGCVPHAPGSRPRMRVSNKAVERPPTG
eukprot:scaffold32692_cov38-Prasinocladus_malaysianus.AAC.1